MVEVIFYSLLILIGTCLTLAILNGYFFDFINNKFFHFTSDENGLSGFSTTSKFIIVVLITPLIETLIFQFIPIEFLKRTKWSKPLFLILVPSLIFSMMHYYHFIYVIMTFVGGIILNYYYLEMQKISKYPFLLTALLHSLYNLYGFLFVV
jgi:hypothetical protein